MNQEGSSKGDNVPGHQNEQVEEASEGEGKQTDSRDQSSKSQQTVATGGAVGVALQQPQLCAVSDLQDPL